MKPYDYYGERKPYTHQVEAVKFMLNNKRGHIFLDIGCGKSSTTLWFIDLLFHHKKIKRVLIIAPLSTLHSVWVNEIKTVCPYRKYAVMHGTREQRTECLKSKVEIIITNTDCPRMYERELIRCQFDIIIIDEITSFANATSARSKSMQRIASKCNSIYGLSGDPVAGGLINSFGIAKIVNPSSLPTPYFTRYRAMLMYQVNMYEYIPKPGAEEIVQRTLSPAIRRRLEDCVDLPEMVVEQRVIELPKETYDLFKTLVKEDLAEYKEGLITTANAGVKTIRLIQLVTGFIKSDEGNVLHTNIDNKLNALYDIYMEAGEKLVVFAQSVETLHILKKYMESKHVKTDLIWGNISLGNRSKIIDDFQSTKNGCLIAQYRTMSHGITLTAAHTLVFFGVINGSESYVQCLKRIRRIGQTKKQLVIQLISTKFEKKLFEKIEHNLLTSKTMLDLYSSEDNFL